MQIQDWNQRWQNNQIGFHEAQANKCLISFIDQFNLAPQATIFVPLCGKSNDLLWLAQQDYNVVGIECSPVAVKDFFEFHQLSYNTTSVDNFTVYKSERITVYQGDFFELNKSHLNHCDLIYDRASLIAFSPQLRERYVAHLNNWLNDTTQLFLITLTYDQNIMNGPPFSVSRQEVEQHYQHKNIQQIRQIDVIDEGPRWRKVGLTSLIDTAYKIN